ncbi:MAG: 3-dehydroquinate synthase [Clostridiales bacterium]|jgi:3-dehydroquinate synthase|nr:3-dehydroquinate synthase [Clostridiales bacterium]
MNSLKINGSTSYDVIIQNNILYRAGNISRDKLGGCKAFIISDRNVGALYLSVVIESFRNAGYDVYSSIFQPGEAAKSFENYEYLLTQLIEAELDRSDVVVALGGGVIGDLSGFAAATFKRGLRLVQIPTSLLACVDSSVGGKTAINLINFKNQVGAFYNPSLVILDPSVIHTQDFTDLQDGYAEIIKYGILSGNSIIDELRTAIDTNDFTNTIVQAIEIKKNFVESDERDKGSRQFLNLGHLIGHAIESYEDYTISHGHAVAYGLAIETRACALSGLTSFSTYNAIIDILTEFEFPIDVSYSVRDLMTFINYDKRLKGGEIELIVPRALGDCYMSPMNLHQVETLIGLAL